MSSKNEFRFAYFTPLYEATLDFYRDGLGLPIRNSWDRGDDDRATVFVASSGLIEVLARPKGESSHLFDARPPQGAFMVIEIDNVADAYARARANALPITQELKDQPWRHRNFCVTEPNGLVLYFYEKIED
jgi:catechol 2,3-dioxygenase-like lactoylglutathione lyase family enzyme